MMPPAPRLLLIDFDGVLADVSDTLRNRELAARLACEPSDLTAALAALARDRRLAGGNSVHHDDLPGLCARLSALLQQPVGVDDWLAARLAATTLRRDCQALLRQVSVHTPVAVLTNNPAAMAAPIQSLLDIDALAGRVLTSGALGLRKPDPACYHAACENLAADPALTLFIDNLFANVQGARTAGLMADTAHHGQSLRKVLKRFHLLR